MYYFTLFVSHFLDPFLSASNRGRQNMLRMIDSRMPFIYDTPLSTPHRIDPPIGKLETIPSTFLTPAATFKRPLKLPVGRPRATS